MIDREWTMVVAIKFRLRSLCILERAVQLHDVVWRPTFNFTFEFNNLFGICRNNN